VHGGEDKDGFENIGRIISDTVFSYLKVSNNVEGFRGLDFGTGCGRVLVPLDHLCRENSLSRTAIEWYGSDIDRQAIAWCQKSLASIGKFVVNKPMPPLPFDNAFFDFVFSISVFTHIPEDMQFAWLAELNRVLKVGGAALLSTMPLDLAGRTLDKDQISYGFSYISGGKGTDGLPKFYQDSFHSRQYIEREWSRYFSIETYKERGVANHQDLVLCRRV
jgi:ubiquinone/menaquinone biosynthesis C-methylase UbiE